MAISNCWCGSGLRFSDCHENRSAEQTLALGEVLSHFRKAMDVKICLHPDATSETCGKSVHAHTLPKSRVVREVSDSTNHVSTFYPPEFENDLMIVKERGWRQASAFNIFCDKHDAVLFSQLEQKEFNGTKEQIFLIAYRSVCLELFQKMRVIHAHPTIRRLIDRGYDENFQREIQSNVAVQEAGFLKGLEDLTEVKSSMDVALKKQELARYECCEFITERPMRVASAGSITPNRSVDGSYLQNMLTSEVTQWLSFGTDVRSCGGSVVFLWEREKSAPSRYIEEVCSKGASEIEKFLIQFFFAHCENTYFSTMWWQSLNFFSRKHLLDLMSNTNPYYDRPEYHWNADFKEAKLLGIRSDSEIN